MRKTTAIALAGAALAGSAAVHAQDAAPQERGAYGSMVLAVGDRVHGFLRGGETHALEVHLAKGDAYSFSVTSNKRGDQLLIHLTLRDPNGNEINSDARVVHYAYGKRVAVGPYVAPVTGTYVIELTGQSWFTGDYWGTSRRAGPRKTVVRLPIDGAPVAIDVAAGATLQLRAKGRVSSLDMALPDEPLDRFAADDSLVASLRAGGLASSATGTYQFAATNVHGGASIEVTRPRWRPIVVEFQALPADATSAAPVQWVNGWRSLITPLPVQPPVVGRPIAVDAPSAAGAATTLFVGAGVDTAIGTLASHIDETAEAPPPSSGSAATPTDPPTPPAAPIDPPAQVVDPTPQFAPVPYVAPPPPPHITPVVPTVPDVPTVQPSSFVDGSTFAGLVVPAGRRFTTVTPLVSVWCISGESVFAATTTWRSWRWAPWGAVSSKAVPLLPPTIVLRQDQSQRRTSGDPSDPFVTRVFDVLVSSAYFYSADAPKLGSITTTTRYLVDDHAVATLVGTKGDFAVSWTISGSGAIGDVPWTLDGAWTNHSHIVDPRRILSDDAGYVLNAAFAIDGKETYAAGGVVETASSSGVTGSLAGNALYDLRGEFRNTLSIPAYGVYQSVVRDVLPRDAVQQTRTVNLTALTIGSPQTDLQGLTDASDNQNVTVQKISLVSASW